MNIDLVNLSKEKGFTIKNIEEEKMEYIITKYYLWMCRLQQWLRDKHECIIVILPFLLEDESLTYEYTNYSNHIQEELDHGDGPFDTYEIALEAALISAVKLI